MIKLEIFRVLHHPSSCGAVDNVLGYSGGLMGGKGYAFGDAESTVDFESHELEGGWFPGP